MGKNTKYQFLIFTLLFIAIISYIQFGAAQPAVSLGAAGNFTILTSLGIENTGESLIFGDVGVSPLSNSTSIKGFGLIMDPSNKFATSSLVNGKFYADDYAPPTPAYLATAVSDMQTAYNDAAGRTLPDYTELKDGNLSGMTLAPGLYKWSTSVIIPTDIALLGNSTDVWIFQIAQTLDTSPATRVILSGGAQANNVFWQVREKTTLGATSVFNGNILDKTSIVLNTGATLNGRALAQIVVILDANNVSLPVVLTETPVLTTITLSPTTANLTIGSTLQLNFTSLDQFSAPIFTIVNYTTNDSSVATVNDLGLVTAIAPGIATITASNSTVNSSSTITISAAYTVNTVSSGGGGRSRCLTNWTCSEWSTCVDGEQTRTCKKEISYCAQTEPQVLNQSCTVIVAPTVLGTDATLPQTITQTTANETETAPPVTTAVVPQGITGAAIGTFAKKPLTLVIASLLLLAIVYFAVNYNVRKNKMKNMQRGKSDATTANKRENADKTMKDKRVRNDKLSEERRSKDDETLGKNRLRNDEKTADK